MNLAELMSCIVLYQKDILWDVNTVTVSTEVVFFIGSLNFILIRNARLFRCKMLS